MAVSLNRNFLIHAYGPKKKVVIMKKNKTIKKKKKYKIKFTIFKMLSDQDLQKNSNPY